MVFILTRPCISGVITNGPPARPIYLSAVIAAAAVVADAIAVVAAAASASAKIILNSDFPQKQLSDKC